MSYYVIYRDSQSQWRWAYYAANNKIIGVSSEGYWNRADCEYGIQLMKGSSAAPVIER